MGDQHASAPATGRLRTCARASTPPVSAGRRGQFLWHRWRPVRHPMTIPSPSPGKLGAAGGQAPVSRGPARSISSETELRLRGCFRPPAPLAGAIRCSRSGSAARPCARRCAKLPVSSRARTPGDRHVAPWYQLATDSPLHRRRRTYASNDRRRGLPRSTAPAYPAHSGSAGRMHYTPPSSSTLPPRSSGDRVAWSRAERRFRFVFAGVWAAPRAEAQSRTARRSPLRDAALSDAERRGEQRVRGPASLLRRGDPERGVGAARLPHLRRRPAYVLRP